MRRPRFFGLSLRAKLGFVALALLVLPWAGYRYVKEMERFLLEGQERALMDTARAVATALHDRPQILSLAPRDDRRVRRQAEEELQRLAAQRAQDAGVAAPAQAPAPESAPQAPPPATRAVDRPAADEHAEIASILRGLERSGARVWVVNRDYRVLALAGSLKSKPAAGTPERMAAAPARLLQPLLDWLIRPPREDFDDAVPDDILGTGRDIGNALRGLPGSRVRNTRDARAVVVSAAHPIWAGDEVVGAVVVEETTNPVVSLSNRATERLVVLTLTVFVVGALVILWLALRVSSRIRRLRDEAEGAVDAHGRITGLTAGSRAGDEIGDLSRSFSAVLAKLGQYHAYLESMASRLSHELRTPIAVVRSSLENLRLQALPGDARVYIERAEEGVARLNTILTRMGEATRLEHSLAEAEREVFDLAAVVAGCVEGYRLAYPASVFALHLPGTPVRVRGAPDLAAQMLDKLVSNAVDFARPGSAVVLSLDVAGNTAALAVSNEGPRLPESLAGRLFESMVSLRPERGGGAEPHLGLGLYIVRVIAEFHGGSARVHNRSEVEGVRVEVRLPMA